MERCEASRPPPAAQAPGLCAWGSPARGTGIAPSLLGAERGCRALGEALGAGSVRCL